MSPQWNEYDNDANEANHKFTAVYSHFLRMRERMEHLHKERLLRSHPGASSSEI